MSKFVAGGGPLGTNYVMRLGSDGWVSFSPAQPEHGWVEDETAVCDARSYAEYNLKGDRRALFENVETIEQAVEIAKANGAEVFFV